MRIAMFSWETNHSIPVGGVAAHVSELSEALAYRGHDVHVFTRMGEGQPRQSRHHGVHYHRCPFGWDPDFVAEINGMCDSFAWHLGETIPRVGGFDIAHGHDWLAAKALVQARNDHYLASVFTIHSTEFGRCGNANHDGGSRSIRDMEWEGGYCSDQVIAVSGVIGKEYQWLYKVPGEKVNPIYNGVRPERFDGEVDIQAVRASVGVGAYEPMVLFCGRLAWQKGPDILMEAVPAVLSQHRDAKIVFVGDGGMRADLEARMHQLGVAHAVRFAGFKRGQDLVDLYKATDMVCVPSRNEPFGIVILEAWAAGKPVVVTHNGGPAEFVRHGKDGWKIYDHPDSVAWGILETFRDFNRARDMGAAGADRIAREFTWDRIAEETEEVYERAITANRRRLGLPERLERPETIEITPPATVAA